MKLLYHTGNIKYRSKKHHILTLNAKTVKMNEEPQKISLIPPNSAKILRVVKFIIVPHCQYQITKPRHYIFYLYMLEQRQYRKLILTRRKKLFKIA